MPLQKEKQKQRIYSPPQDTALAVMEEQPDYTVACPICEKRAIDISQLPERPIKLRYKCPHCRNIVVTPLMAAKDYDKVQKFQVKST